MSRESASEKTPKLTSDGAQSACEPHAPVRSFAHLARVTTGVALLPVGIALLVLPGPGIPVVAASLALLRSEFRWADHVWNKLGTVARRGLERLRASDAS